MSNNAVAFENASKLQRQLAGQITRHIRSQALAPGTQLTELGLAQVLKVSRTPVRAALELLASAGVVEVSQRRGFMVAADVRREVETQIGEEDSGDEEALYLHIASDFMTDQLAEQFSEADMMRRYDVGRGLLARVLRRMALDLVIERNQGHGWHFAPMFKSLDAETESYRFRLLLEPMAILEPGYRLDQQRADASRRAHETILAASTDQLSHFHFFEVNAEFHELVAAGSGNSFVVQAVQQQNRLRRLLNVQWSYADLRIVESCSEHMALLGALEAGELEWAAQLMRRHLELASRASAPEGTAGAPAI